jgi:4-methylaminobutanoate oxidase (formaldehyde-forming)
VSEQARIVIIGGGVIGCAVAYHLARAGEKDVLLLEKEQLTHGSTWHAAGLVGQLRSKRNLTRLMQASVAVLDRLPDEAGQPIDWHKVGSLRLASSRARLFEIKRALTQARAFGVDAELLDAAAAHRRFPFLDTRGIEGAAWVPGDGYVDPASLTQAFAVVARRGGVRFRERCRVTGFARRGRRVTAVLTESGPVACEQVVNCAGIWARAVGALAGIRIAAGAVEHQYMVTERRLDLPADLPTLRDPDRLFYLKPDGKAFAVGGWERNAPALWRTGVPFSFARELLPPSFERFEQIALPAAERVPILNEIGVQTLVNGPIPVSADGEPILGPAPELDNMMLACGFTAGIAASGGAGEVIANWLLHGDPGMDLWALDARRFGELHANPRFLEARMVEAYGRYYAVHWPHAEPATARPARHSPLYATLQVRGAVNGSRFGWERPNWFGDPIDERGAFTEPPGWFDAVGREHRAVRETVAVIDQSSFAKLEVEGPQALAALQRIAANDLDVGDGRCVYTQLCNERGGIEADLVVVRLAEDRFYIVTGASFGVRHFGWICRHLPPGVRTHDVTESLAVINVVGPGSRTLLARVTDADLSNGAFSYLAARQIDVGLASVLALRIGYVGELGWELHVPTSSARHVMECLRAAGDCKLPADVGYRAIDSLRLEKGYVYWGADIGPDCNPYEAGLGFAVALDKGDFIGRAALARVAERGSARRLCTLTVDGWAPLVGGEAVLHRGRIVATTTSAGYGYTIGRTIALAYLPAELAAEETDLEIEAFLERYPVRLGPRALYDPKGLRLRA